MSRRLAIGGLLAAAVVTTTLHVSDLSAQGPDGPDTPDQAPLDAEDLSSIDQSMRLQKVGDLVAEHRRSAVANARERVTCLMLRDGLERARRARSEGNDARAETLLRGLLHRAGDDASTESGHCRTDARTDRRPSDSSRPERARLALAHLLVDAGRSNAALRQLEQVAGATPAPDYVAWLRARAHDAADRPGAAADAYAEVAEHERSPLRWRAMAERGTDLVDAGRPREALSVLNEMIEQFPNYPRRSELLYERARALEQMGEFQRAADAYQKAWFSYPHKPSGDLALARLETLELRGIDTDPISPKRLYSRYRRLRILKHWDLAGRLLRNLEERVATEHGHSRLEHKIQMQLAMNAYIPKRNRQALRRFRRLRRAYEAGHRAGISIDLVHKFTSKTLARMGRTDEALEALERRLAGKSSSTRARELVEFYSDHGRYEEALSLAKDSFSAWRRRQWTYSWLLYKTGRFDQAIDQFEHLAKHRRGRDRAKAMYWTARAHERAGRPEQARAAFQSVVAEDETGYYGIQARNRLGDMRLRRAVGAAIGETTGNLVRNDEQIGAAFELAERGLADASGSRPESTLIPKHPGTSTDSDRPRRLATADCSTEFGSARRICRLLTGRLDGDSPVGSWTRSTPTTAMGEAIGANGATVGPLASRESTAANRTIAGASERGAGSRESGAPDRPRVSHRTQARIYWEGRHDSEAAFERYADGEAIGPRPDQSEPYLDRSHEGGLDRAVDRAGELFAGLRRAEWLRDAHFPEGTRAAVRDVALEFRALGDLPLPSLDDPHELSARRWVYLLDHRRYEEGYWGYEGDPVRRFPVPTGREARRELAERQREIRTRHDELRPILMDAMKEVGEYHLVRQMMLEDEDQWYDRSPSGPTRKSWSNAFPRAFPKQVVSESLDHGINPYLVWSLMTVESAYNPDSISPANAIGLLQVIPRTGNKVATWLGDRDFGPHDLVEPDVAISHGVKYFASLVRKFHGQELFAIAGYNGGPHRVAAWLEQRGAGMPMDEFVEEIPFAQARAYTKKVVHFLSLYLRIYEDRRRLYIGQKIEPSSRPEPNF